MVEEQGSKPSKFRYLKTAGRILTGTVLALAPACNFLTPEKPADLQESPIVKHGVYLQDFSIPEDTKNPLRSLKFFLSKPPSVGLLVDTANASVRLTSCLYGANNLAILAEQVQPKSVWHAGDNHSIAGRGCDTYTVVAGFTPGSIELVRVGYGIRAADAYKDMRVYKLVKTMGDFTAEYLGKETVTPEEVRVGQPRTVYSPFSSPQISTP